MSSLLTSAEISSLTILRGSTGAPSRSPSRAPEPSLARQATANSLATFLSSQSSSQNDRPPAEDLLRDLIAVTESSSNATSNAAHGVKRPHDDEAADEPLPKRDKLGEELDQMFASHPTHASIMEPSVSMAPSASANTPYPQTTDATSTPNPSESTVTLGTLNTLPIRATARRLRRLGNGTGTPHGRPSEHRGPASSSSDDDSEQLVDKET